LYLISYGHIAAVKSELNTAKSGSSGQQ